MLAKRLRKIQILAEKSQGPERDEAARQLQKLLTRHNLTMADIEPLDNEGNPKPAFTRVRVEGVPNQGWERNLLHGLAEVNHGTTVGTGWRGSYGRKGHKVCDLILPKRIVDEVVQLYHYWIAEINYLAKKHKSEATSVEYSWSPRIYMHSYRDGLVTGILSVIKEAAKVETENVKTEGTDTMALVVDMENERRTFVDKEYGSLTYSHSHRRTSFTAHREGYVTGREQSTNIHRKLA